MFEHLENETQKVQNTRQASRGNETRSLDSLELENENRKINQDIKEDRKAHRESLSNEVADVKVFDKRCTYLEVADKQNAAEVWSKVVEAVQLMDKVDYEQVGPCGARTLKYHNNMWVEGATRLVRGPNGKLFIELRRTQGDAFTFVDQFRSDLEKKLVTVECVPDKKTPVDEFRISPQQELEFLIMDLSDGLGSETIQYWIKTIKRQLGQRNWSDVELMSALSSLSLNCRSEKNLQSLKKHASDLTQGVLDVLEEYTLVPGAYFAALCLSKFTTKDFLPENFRTWNTVDSICHAIERWMPSPSKMDSGEVTRSRETVKLLGQTLIQIGSLINDPKPKTTSEKIQKILTLNNKLGERHWNVESIAESLKEKI